MANNSYSFWTDLVHRWPFQGYGWQPWILKLADLQSIKGTCFNKCWITGWIFDFPLWKNYDNENPVNIQGWHGILDQYS